VTLRLSILLAFLGCSAIADEPGPSVDKLIEQLGHRSFVEREKASKALRERGPAALPALRKALANKDEEIRKRIEVLIPPMEIEEALLPKRVTLKADNLTFDALSAELIKQTGYGFGWTGKPNGTTVTIDVK